MYAEDSSRYNYRLPYELPDITMVGWLDFHHEYSMGRTNDEIVSRLRELIVNRTREFDLHVNTVRGIHPCNLCGHEIRIAGPNGRDVYLGMSEIWMPAEKQWFASPSLIFHYMSEHRYVPPKEYCNAIMAVSLDMKIVAQDKYDMVVRAKASR